MKQYRLFFLIFFVALFSTSSVLATKSTLPSICQRFVQDPKSFPRLKEDSLGDNHQRQFNLVLKPKTSALKMQIRYDQGSAGGDDLCLFEEGECESLIYRNIDTNGYGFGLSLFLIRDAAKVYVVGEGSPEASESEDFLGEVQAEGVTVLCEFSKTVTGFKEPKDVQDAALCADLAANKFTKIGATIQADLLHNSTTLSYVSKELASGAGAGCTRQYLELVHKDKNNSEVTALGKAIKELTDSSEYCDSKNQWSLVKIQGKDYVLAGPADALPLKLRGKQVSPRRELWGYRAGKMKRLCLQESLIQRHAVTPGTRD